MFHDDVVKVYEACNVMEGEGVEPYVPSACVHTTITCPTLLLYFVCWSHFCLCTQYYHTS
jgi:hypothetical protein